MILPTFRSGGRLDQEITAAKLNQICAAILRSRPVGSEFVGVSETAGGSVIQVRVPPQVSPSFSIAVKVGDDASLVHVRGGSVTASSPGDKRFKWILVEAPEPHPISPGATVEVFVELTYASDAPAVALDETQADPGSCARDVVEAKIHFESADPEDVEGVSATDKPTKKYYYIGRATLNSDNGAVVLQRRRGDLDVCDPCPQDSSSSSSSSDSGSGGDDPIYVVTNVECSMEPISTGECCVTLILERRPLPAALFLGAPISESRQCCGDA